MNLQIMLTAQSCTGHFFFCLMLCLTACISDPKSHEAVVSNAQQVKEITSKALSYVVDNETSKITWVGSKPTGRHQGIIPITSGEISTEDGEIIGGSFVMDLKGIDVLDLPVNSEDYVKLTTHLKSIDFFDVASHPKALFEITELAVFKEGDQWSGQEAKGEFIVENPNHLITGNLTIKDVTLSITFPAKIQFSTDSISAEARFNIDRTRWDVSYNQESKFVDKAKDGLIYNTVNVGFNVKAKGSR